MSSDAPVKTPNDAPVKLAPFAVEPSSWARDTLSDAHIGHIYLARYRLKTADPTL